MKNSLYCSICGENIKLHEALICRNCGLLYCQFCAKDDAHEESTEFVKHEDFRTDNYACRCDNGDVQLLEELRGYLIQDFLNYKLEISTIANIPVKIFQKFLEIREKIINLGAIFNLMPEDFAFQKDILATFSMAEQFALEYLQDLRGTIRNLYDQLLVNKEHFVEPDELRQVNLRLSLLAGKIEKFQLGFDTYFSPLEEDAESFNQLLINYYDVFNNLISKYKNLRNILEPGERIYYITEPMRSNLGGMIHRHIQIMITNDRIVFFQQPIIKFKKKVKILKIFSGFEITFESKERKFRSSHFVIRKDKETIEISCKKTTLVNLNRFLKLVVESINVPVPKAWKHWQIGKIWSSDSYYSNIDRLLSWQLRPGITPPNLNYPSNIDFSKAGSDLEYQTEIVDYLSKQTEKITQRIRVCEYMINDLKSRKNTMSINEFYSLYETFSMKLKDLENERNSLLGHYSKGATKTPVYC